MIQDGINDYKAKKRGDGWFDPDKGIGYNIKDSQIETYHYNEKTQSWDVTILENPHNGIGVDCEGIIMDPPQNALFRLLQRKISRLELRMYRIQGLSLKYK